MILRFHIIFWNFRYFFMSSGLYLVTLITYLSESSYQPIHHHITLYSEAGIPNIGNHMHVYPNFDQDMLGQSGGSTLVGVGWGGGSCVCDIQMLTINLRHFFLPSETPSKFFLWTCLQELLLTLEIVVIIIWASKIYLADFLSLSSNRLLKTKMMKRQKVHHCQHTVD